MNNDKYIIPWTSILRNKLGITDKADLDRAERNLTTQRARQGLPKGKFDLTHLQAIHKHLFQDVYDWAGELRTVEISKGEIQFQFRQFISNGMNDVHRRIVRENFFKETTIAQFAERVGPIIGDINYCHPFREGNGRTQLLYLQQLAKIAGHRLDLRHIDREAWIEASKEAHNAKYDAMAKVIETALNKSEPLGQKNSKTKKPPQI